MKNDDLIRNIICNTILQVTVTISGFIMPKLILNTFGSEMNGLVSSITQFLNYIILVEGGVANVMLASLYKPLYEKDNKRISSIFVTMNSFFKKIASILLIYSVALSVIYPSFVKSSFSWLNIFLLVLVMSLNSLIQYNYAMSMKLLLQADRKMHIISLTQTAIYILNILLAILVIKIYPEIHILKFLTSLTFLIQPLIYNSYIKKYYNLNLNVERDYDVISQRWDGFGISFADFIHNNTDVIILTLFTNLKTVSVYSVYLLVLNGLKVIISSFSGGIIPTLGHIIVSKTEKEINAFFDKFEFIIFSIVFLIYNTAYVMIIPFVKLYTNNIIDVNYSQPVFSVIILLAEAIHSLRNQYINVAYQAGQFKSITKGAYIDAILNIVISLFFVFKYGLIGVAIGTLIANIYRLLYHVFYLKKNIVFRSISIFLKYIFLFGIGSIVAHLIINNCLVINCTTILSWVYYAVIVFLIIALVYIAIILIFYRNLIKRVVNRN